MNRISFDFDGTLTLPHIFQKAKAMQESGDCELFITTYRGENFKNQPLFDIAAALKIPMPNINFTCMAPKGPVLRNLGILTHYDDCIVTCKEIREDFPECRVIHVTKE